MGYESHFTGRFTITPPLTWAQLQNRPGITDVRIAEDKTVTDTPTGQVTTIVGVAIEPLTRSAYNGYDLPEETQALIDAYPGHEFAGEIAARPLDPGGEPCRWIIRERRVVRQTPRLEWIDDAD